MRAPERSLAVLDVGHGNCAVISTPEGVVVIDAGPGNVLQGYLLQQGLSDIDCVLLSHADEDHIGGLLGILTDQRFKVSRVRVNSDAMKMSKTWDDLIFHLEQLVSKAAIDFVPSLTSSQSGQFDLGQTKIDILGPGPFLATKGPGSLIEGKYLDGGGDRKMTTNSVSAVIRVSDGSRHVALLTGDIDDIALDNLIYRGVDGSAAVVVFPHHGGRPRTADPVAFSKKLWSFAHPRRVIFSIGRNKHDNPRSEIVDALRQCDKTVHIGCTQLSRQCAVNLPDKLGSHVDTAYARGRVDRSCCLGSTIVNLETSESRPDLAEHAKFVAMAAPTPLCQRS